MLNQESHTGMLAFKSANNCRTCWTLLRNTHVLLSLIMNLKMGSCNWQSIMFTFSNIISRHIHVEKYVHIIPESTTQIHIRASSDR